MRCNNGRGVWMRTGTFTAGSHFGAIDWPTDEKYPIDGGKGPCVTMNTTQLLLFIFKYFMDLKTMQIITVINKVVFGIHKTSELLNQHRIQCNLHKIHTSYTFLKLTSYYLLDQSCLGKYENYEIKIIKMYCFLQHNLNWMSYQWIN